MSDELSEYVRSVQSWVQRGSRSILKDALGTAADIVIARSRSAYFAQGGGTGGPLLHVRSGRLWRSLHKSVEISDNQITAEVGSNVVYARIQELGGTIQHASRGQLAVGGRFATVKRAMGARNRTRASLIFIGGHGQTIPPRPYLSTALRDVQPQLAPLILSRIITAWKQKGASGGA